MADSSADDERVAASFERHRPSIIGLAYRMLGSLAEAQDIAQDAYLRFRRATIAHEVTVADAGAFLHKVAARLCLDHLKSAKSRRETYVGTWLPEPVVEDLALSESTASAQLEVHSDISFALLMTLDRLTPPERAAFLLHDVFDMAFADVADAIGQSETSCRQLASRARRHLSALQPRFEPSAESARNLVQTFLLAASTGNVETMRHLLSEEAVLYADGGGKVIAARKPIYGSDRIARFYAGVSAKYPLQGQVAVRLARINGLPGAVVAIDGVVAQTFAFELGAGGRINAVYSTRNPDKLARVR